MDLNKDDINKLNDDKIILDYGEMVPEKRTEHKTRKEKYRHLEQVLTQVEDCKLYKGDVIKGNKELELQRQSDIDELKELISNNMVADGIKFMNIRGRRLKRIQ